ncbi:hypothetical protein CXB51_026613 [Gossypium anomalum]|uniref:Aminotransferase-like plant mobile domain-containing protein n=1 Tax=Gossypium anomalum TaxID=47600 RepID=A0A8J5YL34_9ROSI|nr:hypothetical protein CXB51_026613 [Gossypium anomalum]
MPNPLSPLIENYLREVGFWHVATIGRGCKLDPKLISVLIEWWRPETHTFHLPCGECTITLQDVHLQLELPVDGYVVTGSASSSDWSAVCYELLGAIPDYINGGQIQMGWLRDTFPESDNDSTELERIRYARAYILEIIGGSLMPDLSRNLVHLRWLLKLVDFRAADEELGVCRVGKVVQGNVRCDATEQSQNRRLSITTAIMGTVSLSIFTFSSGPSIYISTNNEVEPFGELCRNTQLSRRYTASIRPTIGYTNDQAIRAVIPDEYFQNPNAWYVNVPLVNYATVEMHQSDRVLRQFGFRQLIPVAPEVFDEEHKVDLRLLNMDWPRYWSGYIEMWENRYDYIPTRESIIVPELACVPEYMPWFRIHGKPYLLSEEQRRRQIRVQRERRGPLNLRRRDDDAGPSTTPTQSTGPSTVPIQSASPSTAPSQSPGPIVQQTTPTSQPFPSPMPGTYPIPYMYPNPFMFPFPNPMVGWNPWLGSSPSPITPSQLPICRRRRMRDRRRRHRGALFSTNPHYLTGFKHLLHG